MGKAWQVHSQDGTGVLCSLYCAHWNAKHNPNPNYICILLVGSFVTANNFTIIWYDQLWVLKNKKSDISLCKNDK